MPQVCMICNPGVILFLFTGGRLFLFHMYLNIIRCIILPIPQTELHISLRFYDLER